MFFNRKNLWALLVLILFLCIISFLLGVYTLRNGTLRKAYDIFFALGNLDQRSLPISNKEVNKIDTITFLNTKKKQNNLIKIRSNKFNSLESVVTYGFQWKSERPWLKSNFQFKDRKIDGKFKLIGLNSDHFREANNWSTRLKLKGDEYIYKYQKFNLLVPFSRGFFIDAFYNELYKKNGGLSIDSKPIITRLNDKYQLQIFEPFFSKEIIENQNYRDFMIISGDSIDKLGRMHLNVLHPNGYDKLTENQKNIYNYYENKFQNNQLQNYFEIKNYAFLGAVSINTNLSIHHLLNSNLNLYVNPLTGRLHPFLREIDFIPYSIPQKLKYTDLKKQFLKLVNLNSRNFTNFKVYSEWLDIYSKYINDLNIDSIINFNYNLKNLYYYSNKYYPWSFAFKKRIKNPIVFDDLIKNRPLVEETENNSNLLLNYSNGIYHLKNVVFKNHNLRIVNSTIIFSGKVMRLGNKKIIIEGDSSSTVIFENAQVNLSNVEFIGFGNRLKIQNRAVTSAITFYDSVLQLNNVIFRNNYSGDDLVNIFRSKFALKNVTVQNSKYDAIDVDFSYGLIQNCEIDKSGNDGLDFGGSQVIVHNTRVNNCGDKGISVGEKSTVQIFTSSITNSEIGFGLKDESLLRIRGIKLNNNHLDLAAYAKKGLFDSSTLDVFPKEFNSFRYLIEPGVKVKNNIVYKTTQQAKNQLYGKKYGKASVR